LEPSLLEVFSHEHGLNLFSVVLGISSFLVHGRRLLILSRRRHLLLSYWEWELRRDLLVVGVRHSRCGLILLLNSMLLVIHLLRIILSLLIIASLLVAILLTIIVVVTSVLVGIVRTSLLKVSITTIVVVVVPVTSEALVASNSIVTHI
jgi:hypothetical protein